jgi:hypothetical protein
MDERKDSKRRPRNYQRERAQRAQRSQEPQPEDAEQAWPRAELEEMNERFAQAIAAAAKKGQ